MRRGRLAAALVTAALGLAPPLAASERPRYDVPAGFTKCPGAKAWNGFFKWASVRHTTCREAARFMRAYGDAAEAEAEPGTMPRRVRRFRCTIRFWRNEEGDIYASRHRCERRRVVIRFYGMV